MKSFVLAITAVFLQACAPAIPAFAETAPDRVPTDARSLNAFIARYNTYADELSAGQIDVRQWKRVEEAWKGLR